MTRSQIRKSPSPIRGILQPASTLNSIVQNGLDALDAGHKDYISPDLRQQFADSLALDAAMRLGHEQENRWDYLLGHQHTKKVIGLEPHSAKQDEVSTVIAKRRAAIEHLRPHLKEGAFVQAWFWVASGKVYFADTEKIRLKLDQAGINFVGKQILPKHLEAITIGKRR